MNWLWTLLLGVGGAVVGGFIGNALGFDNQGFMSWVFAIGASIGLLVLYNLTTAGRSRLSGPAAPGGLHTSNDYKRAVFDDLARGPRS